MFALQVTASSVGDVKNLRGGRVSCMHCPMYFSFEASPAIVSAVISEHQLNQVAMLPKLAGEVEVLVQREASWWKPARPKEDRVYWVSYSPSGPALEPAFRLLVVKGGQAFFITSGHFATEHYTRDDA